MKKVTIISLLISIMVSLFGVCGYAADFKETSMYYDFNNYDICGIWYTQPNNLTG